MSNRGRVLMEVQGGLPEVMACQWIADRADAVYRHDGLAGDSLDLAAGAEGWAREDRGWIELDEVNWFDDAAVVAAAPNARWQAYMSPDTEQPGMWLAFTPQTGLVEGSHIEHEVTVPVAWADPAARSVHAGQQLSRIQAAQALLAGGPAQADPRSSGNRTAVAALRRALSDPAASQALLALAFNDRGLRDAVIAMAAADGNWQGLAGAAQAAGRYAAATGQHSIYGPAAVLGVVAWAGGRRGEAAEILMRVPPDDPASRIAELATALCERNLPPGPWVAQMAAMDPAEAAAFVSPAARPGPHTAPADLVDRWFRTDLSHGGAAAGPAPAQHTHGRRTTPPQSTAAPVRPPRSNGRGMVR